MKQILPYLLLPYLLACQPITPSNLTSSLSQIITRELAAKEIPAFSIALVDDQQIIWAEGFGTATADTVYRVGSVSKLFTDLAIMQLVERGQLDLDA